MSRSAAPDSSAAPDGGAAPQIRPLTALRLEDLAVLFETNNTTKGCWCMWFRAPRREVHAGWGGQNRTRFETLAAADSPPAGLLAYQDGEPVGWCAVGPRSRFSTALSPRSRILRDRDPDEDDDVWLVPCFFVRVGYRRTGLTRALLRAAVGLGREHGAKAVEGFPLATHRPDPLHAGAQSAADRYLGTERLFAECGFTRIAAPTPSRVVMRYDLKS